ncbi:Rrf2 family transcriptional regulator [Micromonospora sp. NPDC050686]|uniref:RrF2 family transcriptional regulator n=1 Tax=Micromonospora sp. NPDC050686 TaxID=3154631 RepID=UPI003408C285
MAAGTPGAGSPPLAAVRPRRSGGVAFADRAEEITVGRVVRAFEGEDEVVACEESGCTLRAGCRLRGQLRRAQAAFLAVLDEVRLGDLVDEPSAPLLLALTAAPR